MGERKVNFKVGQLIFVPMRIVQIEDVPEVDGAIFTCSSRAVIGTEQWEGSDPKYFVARSGLELIAAGGKEVLG